MAQEAIRLVSPVGRIIWGSVSERAAKDYDGKDYAPGTGPFQFGLAILKTDPGLADFLGKIYQQAVAGYPNNQQMAARIQNEWQSGFAGLNFRFKIKDGDKPNANGQHNPNSAGCFVFSLSTSLPFKCANDQNQEIDAKTIERGYFVRAAISCKVNENLDGTAGIYLNHDVVQLLAFGEKIVGGISIDDAFAGAALPTQLPPGASAVPVAPSGLPGFPAIAPTMAPGYPAQAPAAPAMGYPSNGTPAMPGFPAQSTGAPPSPTGYPTNPATGQPFQPHTGFVMPGS